MSGSFGRSAPRSRKGFPPQGWAVGLVAVHADLDALADVIGGVVFLARRDFVITDRSRG